MTRETFIAKATRAAEKALGLPPGWWGTWTDVHGPNGEHVTLVRRHPGLWVVSLNGKVVDRYPYGVKGRLNALRKARRLVPLDKKAL